MKQQYIARYLLWCCITLLCLLVASGIILFIKWPFTEQHLLETLEHVSSSEVRLKQFHKIYFPHPGYVADGITFWRKSPRGEVQLGSVRRFEARATWMALLTLTHRLQNIRLEGLRVVIPNPVPAPMNLYPSLKTSTTVTTLVADGAVLQIAARSTGGQAFQLNFPQLTLGNIEKQKSITLQTRVRLPEPPGNLAVNGRFGPMVQSDPGRIPLFGSFQLADADLGKFKAIGGILRSDGDFRGTLASCEVRGNATIPDFEVTSSGHAMPFDGKFDALVNAIQKRVTIRSISAHLLNTALQANGNIASTSGQKGETVWANIETQHGRVEDLLRLFTSSAKPAVDGPIAFQTKVVLPPGDQQFIRKVQLEGDFAISRAQFTHADTQAKLNKLSERARKSKDDSGPQQVLADVRGHVHLQNGTAILSHMVFTTPGATASGGGTYSLLDQRVDLHGKLAMQASLSKAAGGIKSVLLLPLDPFFKKKNAGAVLPVKITGTYSHPTFGVSLTGKK
ncbi:MAG TPA: AsmA-like C-terminal region-containing protein [Bryobacteraceae bacterium]|nr:AsmA-like C-terminal region-containing protein [Bryobacteraceae bacterium]